MRLTLQKIGKFLGRFKEGAGAGEACFFDQCRCEAAKVRLELGDDRGVGEILDLDRIDERNFEETDDVG
jgi:hypothetical protein